MNHAGHRVGQLSLLFQNHLVDEVAQWFVRFGTVVFSETANMRLEGIAVAKFRENNAGFDGGELVLVA